MIKAVVFDMNGVIIDDEHIHEMIFQKTIKPWGINLSHQDYLTCCLGKTDRAGYQQIALKFSKNLPVDKLTRQKNRMYLKLFPTHKKAYPEVIDLIHSLAKNFTLALTSSALRTEVDLITKEFGINQDFKVTVSANDVTKGKPDPEPYLTTANKLGLQPQECVVIEDSRSGVLSAKVAAVSPRVGKAAIPNRSENHRAVEIIHSPNSRSPVIEGLEVVLKDQGRTACRNGQDCDC